MTQSKSDQPNVPRYQSSSKPGGLSITSPDLDLMITLGSGKILRILIKAHKDLGGMTDYESIVDAMRTTHPIRCSLPPYSFPWMSTGSVRECDD